MVYFALNADGLLYDLGDHGDAIAAECTADDMKLNALFIFDEDQAHSIANFLRERA